MIKVSLKSYSYNLLFMEKSVYPTRYSDKYGTDITEILNDGKELSIVIRGVEFKDTDFDSFKPVEETPPDKLKSFSLDSHQFLVDYKLECNIPILIGGNNKTISCCLKMKLILGKLTSNNRVEEENLKLELACEKIRIKSNGLSGYFEDEMLDIQKAFPAGYFLKCCFGCLYSDYNVAGHSLFGSMMCFRDNKEKYLAVKTKSEYIEIMDSMTEFVQETYLCPEFKKRIPGTGYRG